MERITAALYLDLGLFIRTAFDITSDKDTQGSVAAYKKTFAEQRFDRSNPDLFALRAWACYIKVQGLLSTSWHLRFKTDQGKFKGRVKGVSGKSVEVAPKTKFSETAKIEYVVTVGKEGLTIAGTSRASLVLGAFEGAGALLSSPFRPKMPKTQPKINFTYRPLNAPQRKAGEKCLSNEEEDRRVVVVGPPGTGKTTVIAAAVQRKVAERGSNTVWSINVAEKFVDSSFLYFKLLVSQDSHFDWHEHLYEAILDNMIDSGEFQKSIVDNEGLLMGSRVILCTTSMLSGNRVMDSAPYGQEDIPELRSVFEWSYLRDNEVFLNTQRISNANNHQKLYISPRLLFETPHRTQYSTRTCCRFVGVSNGGETKKGVSWSKGEIQAAVRIAKQHIQEGKNFKIITPYGAQRNAIENALKTAGLTWENAVFNVDYFQGNEKDHIVVSVVRTSSLGFTKNMRRTNVMLSRCKKSMVNSYLVLEVAADGPGLRIVDSYRRLWFGGDETHHWCGGRQNCQQIAGCQLPPFDQWHHTRETRIVLLSLRTCCFAQRGGSTLNESPGTPPQGYGRLLDRANRQIARDKKHDPDPFLKPGMVAPNRPLGSHSRVSSVESISTRNGIPS
ncbi:P-loop containing nucleoside triphosphate hydrolase protein [Thelephora terrestris]|uniref:P-loop containing nucleoside triphosphate hydrolase protein n=1 Tax=Thelephora terrestris TaxID=56493 RepID=A0A9P6L7Z3_9AGAM|nr:P-loop containing nucleoside triphosphate hydrolase protein [Thelephora terrestris]